MVEIKQYSVAEATRDWKFYALWWIFFTNITCGIGLLAVASPMAQEVVHMSPIAAAPWLALLDLSMVLVVSLGLAFPIISVVEILIFYFS